MSLKVVHGKVQKDMERLRVTFLGNVKGETALQFVDSVLLLQRFPGAAGVPKFGGPVYAGWDNLRHRYPEQFHDLDLIGAITAVPDGEWKGHIDWIKPVDGGKIMEMRRAATAAHEPEPPKHEMLKFPLDLKSMSEQLMFDPVLNGELSQTTGGADLIECILRAAIRLVKEEA